MKNVFTIRRTLLILAGLAVVVALGVNASLIAGNEGEKAGDAQPRAQGTCTDKATAGGCSSSAKVHPVARTSGCGGCATKAGAVAADSPCASYCPDAKGEIASAGGSAEGVLLAVQGHGQAKGKGCGGCDSKAKTVAAKSSCGSGCSDAKAKGCGGCDSKAKTVAAKSSCGSGCSDAKGEIASAGGSAEGVLLAVQGHRHGQAKAKGCSKDCGDCSGDCKSGKGKCSGDCDGCDSKEKKAKAADACCGECDDKTCCGKCDKADSKKGCSSGGCGDCDGDCKGSKGKGKCSGDCDNCPSKDTKDKGEVAAAVGSNGAVLLAVENGKGHKHAKAKGCSGNCDGDCSGDCKSKGKCSGDCDNCPSKKKASTDGVDVGDKAPGFTLTAHNGKKVSLSDLKGKTVVLEWFNFDCPFVKPHYQSGTFKNLANRYDDENVVWLAINSTHYVKPEQNKKWAKTHNVPYPILSDADGKVGKAYGAKTTPHMFIINPEGVVAYEGAIDNNPRGKNSGKTVNYVNQALAAITSDEQPAVRETKPYGCSVKYPPANPDARQAPSFTLKDHNGQQVSLSDYRGKVVVLEWFNFDCPFVRPHYETGTFKTLADKYADDGVVWLAINSTHYVKPQQNRDWAEKYDLPYPILSDTDGKVGKAYGAKTTPHLFIINGSGNIVYEGAIDNSPRGKLSEGVVNYADKALEEVTSGQSVSTPFAKPYGCSVKYKK
jgi:peroxiredoxin